MKTEQLTFENKSGPFLVGGNVIFGFAVMLELKGRQFILLAPSPNEIHEALDDLCSISGSTETALMDESKGKYSGIANKAAFRKTP